VYDDIHRIGEQQMREQQEAARKQRAADIKKRMQKWRIGREPAEHILDLEIKIRELERAPGARHRRRVDLQSQLNKALGRSTGSRNSSARCRTRRWPCPPSPSTGRSAPARGPSA